MEREKADECLGEGGNAENVYCEIFQAKSGSRTGFATAAQARALRSRWWESFLSRRRGVVGGENEAVWGMRPQEIIKEALISRFCFSLGR